MEMEVLRLENIERRVLDQNILLTALKLGRDASLGLKGAKRVLHNEPVPLSSGSEQDLLPLLYRTAMSTSSDSSSEYTTSSSRATSLTTASSIISTTSSRSPLLKLRNRIKRLSNPTKRRTLEGPKTSLSLPNSSRETIDDASYGRPTSAHSITLPVTPPFQPLRSLSLPPPLAVDFPIYYFGRFSCAFESYPISHTEEEYSPEVAAAKERSRLHPYLQSQRDKAFEEQSNLLQEYYTKRQALCRARETSKQSIVSSRARNEGQLKVSHSTALSELEPKHLNAEQELENDLATEQRNLDIRIKHMTGYCSGHGSSSPEGTLKRKVTKSDRMSLKQQEHVREGMDSLHKARINVLRAKQAKQLERLMEKQRTQLEDLHAEYEKTVNDEEDRFRKQEQELKQEMMAKKQRLSKRWNFEEAFTRWRLEVETGLSYGPLPIIEWSEDEEGLGSWNGVSVFNEEDDNNEATDLYSD